MVFVGDISIVFMGFINQFITRGAPPCVFHSEEAKRDPFFPAEEAFGTLTEVSYNQDLAPCRSNRKV